MIEIREATEHDFEAIWPIFHEVAKAGETYAYSPDTNKEQAFSIWMSAPNYTYVLVENGVVMGTYYLKTNQAGPGQHVCNCGYMVSSLARGKGFATIMCEHSQQKAVEFGYKAMQYNFVAASNDLAVKLWLKLGFSVVGTLPKAFNHPRLGYVDALVMYKWLAD